MTHSPAGVGPTDVERARRIEFGVLGPVEATRGGERLPLGGSKQRALLAVLVLHANEVVSTEQLIDELWADDPPATAVKMVQVYVSRLRHEFERADAENGLLVTSAPGYVLRLARDQADLDRFQGLAEAGHAARPDRPDEASQLFASALALWRGAALSDVALEPFAQAAIPRLDELRLATLEERIDVDLALGRHGRLVGELRELVGQHPLRERFRLQLMLALYRSGRQAEALEAYRDARVTLSDELGIEPSPELQQLETAVLRQDPSLDLPATTPTPLEEDEPSSPRRRSVSVLVAIASALVAMAVVIVIAVAVHHGKDTSAHPVVQATANSVLIVDPQTDSPVNDIPVGAAPGPITIGGGAAWVGNVDDHTVTRIDLRSLQAVKIFGLSGAPVSLTGSADAVWIGNGFAGTLSRIIVAYDQLSAPFFPGPTIGGLLAVAVDPNDLWVGLGNGTLLQLDPPSLRQEGDIEVPGRVLAIALTGGQVWTIQFRGNDVDRIDPVAGRVADSVPVRGVPVAIAAGDGSVWVATSGNDTLWRIDPATDEVVASVRLSAAPTAVAVGDGAVWVAEGPTGGLARVDPTGGALVTTLDIGHPIGGIAVANGDIWLTLS